jgi:hypothetical protein
MSTGNGTPVGDEKTLAWQVALVVSAWLYVCGLHWHNDGLWYQGDAPRHATNGQFLKEFLLSGSLDPTGYALSYYARYPVIHPTAYPPVFYVLEGIAYGLFGQSPFIAKGLVLAFALLAALYTLAWLRRWLLPEAGWLAALLPLLPGLVCWSHAIMLNVPALSLGLAALYHGRRWLEAAPAVPAHLHFYATAALSVLTILTYFPGGVVVFILLAWLLALGRAPLLWQPRTLLVGILCALVLLPWALLVRRWAPAQLAMAIPREEWLWSIKNWTLYPRRLSEIVNLSVVALAGCGVAAGLLSRRWRRETLLLLLWLAVCQGVFSLLPVKETRYLLLVCPVFVCLGALALVAVAGWLEGSALRLTTARWGILVGVLLLVQAWFAGRVVVPSVEGFRAAVAFVEQVAPKGPVFYHGRYDGVFTFYLQAGDPAFQRRVVLGSKLFWPAEPRASSPPTESSATAGQVIEALQTRSGCRWIAVEEGDFADNLVAMPQLREAVKGSEFELVQSFPIEGRGIHRVDLYRLILPFESSAETVELPFPHLRRDSPFSVRPTER